MGDDERGRPARSPWVRRILGWALAIALVIGWIVLLRSPGTLPWIFVAVATVAAVVLVTSVWNARPRGETDTVEH